jgi:ABC-type bacteriocin/lantibiotic exporter with double-glycine peptidase domain
MVVASFAEVLSIGAIFPFLTILTSPTSLFSNKYFQYLNNYFLVKDPMDLLLPLTIMFVVAIIFSSIMRYIVLWFQTKLCFAIGADFSYSIYHRTLYQPYTVHISRNSSEVIDVISTKISSIIYHVLLPLLTTISSMVMVLIVFAAMIALNPMALLLAVLGFGILYFIIIKLTKKKLTQNSEIIGKESTQVIRALQEGLGAIRDVLLEGSQSVYSKHYQKSDLKLRNAQAGVIISGGSPKFGIEALGVSVIAFLAYSLAIRPEGVSSAIPTLGAWALGAQRILPIIHQAYACWSSIIGSQSSLSNSLDLLDQPLPDFVFEDKQIVNFQKHIELKNLNFFYGIDNHKYILSQINLIIPKGTRVGFIGNTGSGKSTLLDVIMGLLNPISGQVIIDNVVLEKNNLGSWQKNISHVPQVIFMSDNTIAENIAFGVDKSEIDYDRVKEAARSAKIAETIELMDEKYETKIGERGVRLSGGQRQRIGIARALYKYSKVIILDEATSALDNETENKVMQEIEELDKDLTILIVAHRLTTLKNCDMIVELVNGQIKRKGTYNEIILAKSNI